MICRFILLVSTGILSAFAVGSGVSQANIDLCNRYADVVIVGSSLKRNGYWENPVDEERVKQFMEVWHG